MSFIVDVKQEAMRRHYQWKGKIEVNTVAPVATREDLSLAYTPGVAEPCLAIRNDPSLSYKLTRRWNLVAVVSDGTAVLGLGDIGPEAAMPVMEGKCALFKAFGGVDAFPICVGSKDPDEIIRTVELIAPSFGGVNLEDISAPRCFEIERRLKKSCPIPVFHDDQHGTAIVVAAALVNALAVVHKDISAIRLVLGGPGAAGVAVARLLMTLGAKDLTLCDEFGALYRGRDNVNPYQMELVEASANPDRRGSLKELVEGADVYIGLSRPNQLTAKDVARMNRDAVVFGMANPTPEILPDEAKAGGAAIVGTGRSDFPNQINNLLAFPGVFAGVLRVRASDITDGMKLAAARAIAELARQDGLSADYILPSPLDKRVAPAVADAVAKEAVREGLARA